MREVASLLLTYVPNKTKGR